MKQIYIYGKIQNSRKKTTTNWQNLKYRMEKNLKKQNHIS